MKPGIGIKEDNRKKVAQALSALLADEVVLYIKTRNAHWNVEGPDFHTKHIFFEQQYNEIDDIMDDVAERLRSIGHYAPATLQVYKELTHLTELSREKNDAHGYLHELLADHESIIVFLR